MNEVSTFWMKRDNVQLTLVPTLGARANSNIASYKVTLEFVPFGGQLLEKICHIFSPLRKLPNLSCNPFLPHPS